MDARQFERAEKHREQCMKKVELLRAAEDFSIAENLWSEFLVEQHRWFTRMQQAFSKGPSSAWFGKIKKLRQTDDLLSYLQQARHADEHGLEKISEGVPGSIGVGGGGGPMFIRSLRMQNGIINIEGYQGDGPLTVQFTAAHLKLKSVENRGVMYPPPRYFDERQNGIATNATALQAGELALKFMNEKSAEGKRYFDQLTPVGQPN